MSDIDRFIDEEEQKLSKILFGLPIRKRIDLSPKVQFIQYLLSLLQKASPQITKEEKKEIIEKIKKETKNLDNKKRDEQVESMSAFNAGKAVKPNITEIDDATIMKAKMVKASSVAYDSDFNQAQMFLDQNKIPYNIDTELSDAETLVLHNPETEDVKLASRGTKITNAKDLLADGQTILGYENSNSEFQKALKQGQKAITKYGKANVSEGLGYSLGGAKQIYVTDALGIPNSTTFNPLIGKSFMGSGTTSTTHNLFRTTEDIPSMPVGLKSKLENVKVSSILPKKISLDIREAHKLDNFTSNEQRVKESQFDKLAQEVAKRGKRIGEAEIIRDMANDAEGAIRVRKPAEVPRADPNLREKLNSHSGNDPFLEHGFKIVGDPNKKMTSERMTENNPFYETRTEEDVMRGLLETDNQSRSNLSQNQINNMLNRNKPIKKTKKTKTKIPDELKSKKDYSKEIEDLNNQIKDINEELPIHEALSGFTLDDVRATPAEARFRASQMRLRNLKSQKEEFTEKLKDLQSKQKESQSQKYKERLNTNDLFETNGKSHLDLLTDIRKTAMKNVGDKLYSVPEQKQTTGFTFEDPLLQPHTDVVQGEVFRGSVARPYTYAEFAHNFNSRRGSDTVVNEQGLPELRGNRFSTKSKLHTLWEENGGMFTQKELNHFDEVGDTQSTEFELGSKERHFLREDTPAGRDEQINQLRQEHIDAVNDLDNYASLPDDVNAGTRRGVTNDLIRSANPVSFLIGYYGGKGMDKLVDKFGIQNQNSKAALIGAGVGYGTEASMLAAGGEAASILTASVALPALAAGAVGSITGGETYKYLRKKGVSDPVASAGAGSVGGAAAGLTAGLVSGGVALATTEGATIGTAFDPVTMGTGTLIGAGVGALFGEGAYLMGKAGL